MTLAEYKERFSKAIDTLTNSGKTLVAGDKAYADLIMKYSTPSLVMQQWMHNKDKILDDLNKVEQFVSVVLAR